MEPPFSSASARNAGPILKVIQPLFRDRLDILEIGSGTGQHAVTFAPALPGVRWHASDLLEHHAGIRAWMAACPAPNVRGPLALDVTQRPWPVGSVDAVFSANTAHIMSWLAVCAMFSGVAALLPPGGLFCLYGPFNLAGCFTSASNEAFHKSLRARCAHMGIRDRDALVGLATTLGMQLRADHEMPANNRLLVFGAERAD